MPFPHPPSLPESHDFDYAALDRETRSELQGWTNEIKGLVRQTAENVVCIGRRLTASKEKLGHGRFENWLRAEFGWSLYSARRFMQVYRHFKTHNLCDLNIAISALYLLARPSTPEEARQEALEQAAQGETITHAVAKEIVAGHTIDVAAEVVEDDPPAASPDQLASEPASRAIPTPDQPGEPVSTPAEMEPETPTEVKAGDGLRPAIGDRVRILRRQKGQDKWSGKTARIWEITPDGRLRVAVEGHKGVRFTLKPEWVEPVTETPENYKAQPEPGPVDPADEPDPESSIDMPSEEENEAAPRFQAGDRLQGTNLGQQNQEWTGEVAEVLEASETEIMVVLRIPR